MRHEVSKRRRRGVADDRITELLNRLEDDGHSPVGITFVLVEDSEVA